MVKIKTKDTIAKVQDSLWALNKSNPVKNNRNNQAQSHAGIVFMNANMTSGAYQFWTPDPAKLIKIFPIGANRNKKANK